MDRRTERWPESSQRLSRPCDQLQSPFPLRRIESGDLCKAAKIRHFALKTSLRQLVASTDSQARLGEKSPRMGLFVKTQDRSARTDASRLCFVGQHRVDSGWLRDFSLAPDHRQPKLHPSSSTPSSHRLCLFMNPIGGEFPNRLSGSVCGEPLLWPPGASIGCSRHRKCDRIQ